MTHVWQVVNPGKCGGCEPCGGLEQHYICIQCGLVTFDLEDVTSMEVVS